MSLLSNMRHWLADNVCGKALADFSSRPGAGEEKHFLCPTYMVLLMRNSLWYKVSAIKQKFLHTHQKPTPTGLSTLTHFIEQKCPGFYSLDYSFSGDQNWWSLNTLV